MLSKFCAQMSQSKNVLMLISTGVYIFSLYCVLSENIFWGALLFTSLMIFIILREYLPSKYVFIWCLIFYFGILNTSSRLKDVDELLSLAPVNSQITGTILTIPQGKAENKPKFFFNVDKIKFGSFEKEFKSEKVLVTVNQAKLPHNNTEDLKLYNTYIMYGRLSTPFKAGNPSQFDYGNYLRNYNTYAVFYANDYKLLDTNLSKKEKFLQNVNNYREKILALHSKYMFSPNLEILGGIVFGDDAVSPPQNIKQSFINSGLLHILAASGMNVAFIYGFFFFLMSLIKLPFKLRVALGMVMVVIYSLMTGLGASVIRATCMLLFVLAGKLINRDAHSISLLSFVALLMLVYNPLWINDVGFQLSFAVTFGILVMSSVCIRFKNKILDFISSTISIPIIAQLWVIPIQIFYFNNISVYSVFANIMSVPILMILSFGGFLSSLLAGITPISDFICKTFDFALNPLISILINISDFWGRLPYSSFQTTHPSVFQIFIYYGILLLITAMFNKNLKERYFKKLLCAVFILTAILFMSIIPVKNHHPEITAFDVGNADCFLIKTPEGKYIMIDTAKAGYNGGKSQAEIIVLKYMRDNGIKNIDSIIVTHFDNDHCGGAVDMIKEVDVSNLYVNDLHHNSLQAQNIYKTAKKRHTKLIAATNNQVLYNKDGLKLVNLQLYDGKSDNDNSIITLLTYKDFSMLFTGDAGIDGIKSVLHEIPKSITVLKVPHHGAVGGVDKVIMQYLNPKYSLISTGENKFGHPSIYTLELLKNSITLRTDINNSIRFVISDKGVQDMKIFTYDIKSKKYKPYVNRDFKQ